MYTYAQTNQIISFKYVQFSILQLYHSKGKTSIYSVCVGLEVPVLRFYLREMKIGAHNRFVIEMFIAALLVIVKNWNEAKGP